MSPDKMALESLLKEWIKPLGILFICSLMIFLTVFLMVRPRQEQRTRLQREIKRTETNYQRFNNFDEFGQKLRQQKETVTAIINEAGIDVSGTERTEQNFLDEIGRICKESSIKLDVINPAGGENRQKWSIGFTADFRKIYRFCSLIERTYRIENMQISSGEDRAQHRVEMQLSAIAGDASPSPGGAAGVFEIFDKTEESIGRMKTKQRMADIGEIRKDPLLYADTLFPPEKARKPVVQAPVLEIEGIFWDPETPIVVIEGRALREGESIHEVEIKKIRETNVIVRWQSQDFTIKYVKKENQ